MAAGIIWGWLLSLSGLVNQILDAIGLDSLTRAWLGDFDWALPAVGLIGVWVLLGFCTVLLLTGMSKIDTSLYEAARIDGAGWFAEFRAVTLPGLRYEIGVCLTVTVDRRARRVRHRLRLDRRGTRQLHRGARHPDLHPRLPRAPGRPGVGARGPHDVAGARRHPPHPAPDAAGKRMKTSRGELYGGSSVPAGADGVHRPAVPQHPHHCAAAVGIAAERVWSGRADPQWGNFVDAFNVANMTALLKSSSLIVLMVVPVALLISTMAGFAIGLLRIPGARWLLCCCSCSG